MAGLERVIVYTKSTIGVERGCLSRIEESQSHFRINASYLAQKWFACLKKHRLRDVIDY